MKRLICAVVAAVLLAGPGRADAQVGNPTTPPPPGAFDALFQLIQVIQALQALANLGNIGGGGGGTPTPQPSPTPSPTPPPVGTQPPSGPTAPTIPMGPSACTLVAIDEFDLAMGSSGPIFPEGPTPFPDLPFPDRTELIATQGPTPAGARCDFRGVRILDKFPVVPKLPLLVTDLNPPNVIQFPSISIFVEDSKTLGGCRIAQQISDFFIGGTAEDGLICESIAVITYIFNESREPEKFTTLPNGVRVRVPKLSEAMKQTTIRYRIITPDSFIAGLLFNAPGGGGSMNPPA